MSFVGITVGNAVAALAFTFAIQQFLRPIHLFRLRSQGLPINVFYIAIFIAAGFVFAGNFVRSFEILPSSNHLFASILEYVGAALFIVSYLGVAFIATIRPRFSRRNAIPFTQAAFSLMSKAKEEDYVRFFHDIVHNITEIFELAKFNEQYRFAGIGRERPSAFFDFIHRHTIERSAYAGDLLSMLSDSRFCKAIITHDSTAVVQLLAKISHGRLHSSKGQRMIQELARQSILLDSSMLEREVGYHGFSHIGLFLESMFGDSFIVRSYKPLNKISAFYDVDISHRFVERLSAAVQQVWKTGAGEIWHPQSVYDVARLLDSLSSTIRSLEEKDTTQWRLSAPIPRILQTIVEASNKEILELTTEERRSLYKPDEETSAHEHIASLTAEIIFDYFCNISNGFLGFEDKQWVGALDVFGEVFPSGDTQPAGLDPIQQHLALRIIGKVRDNMIGYYPAITRLLLAVIGPYGSRNGKSNSAFQLLEDAFYFELRRFSALAIESPEKVSDYLPPNVRFQKEQSVLVHRYAFNSGIRETNLNKLNLGGVDFYDKSRFVS